MNKELNTLSLRPPKYEKRITNLLSKEYLLITISACTGYGKTDLVYSYLDQSRVNTIWISNSLLCNDLERFWYSFVNAFSECNKEFAEYLDCLSFPNSESDFYLIADLFTEKFNDSEAYVMVFDDFHFIEEPKVKRFIENIILMKIKNLKFIVISREPVLFEQIGKYSSDCFDLTSNLLSYNAIEIEEYYAVNGIILNSYIADMIYKKTAGWPLAVNLFYQCYEENGCIINYDIERIEDKIFDIINSDIDNKYLIEEQQTIFALSAMHIIPNNLIRYLIQKKIGNKNGIQIAVHHFLRIDKNMDGYYFPEIFKRCFEKRAADIPQLLLYDMNKYCGDWYYENKYYAEALLCYEKCCEYARMKDIIFSMMAKKISKNEGMHICSIIKKFPEQFLDDNPHLEVAYGAVCIILADYDMADLYIYDLIQRLLLRGRTDNIKSALSDAYLAYALLLMSEGKNNFTKYTDLASKYAVGRSIIFNKNYTVLNNIFVTIFQKGPSGEMDLWVNEISKSIPVFNKLADVGYGYEYLAKALNLYLKGDMKAALEYAYYAVFDSEAKEQIDIVCLSYFTVCKIEIASGNYKDIKTALKKMNAYISYHQEMLYFQFPDIINSRFYSIMLKFDQVAGWIKNEDLYNRNEITDIIGVKRIINATILLEKGKYMDLLKYLKLSEDLFTETNMFLSLISVYLLQAIAYDKMGNTQKAVECFQKSYNFSCKNKIIMPFIEYGQYTRTLIFNIKNHTSSGIPKEWLDDICKKSFSYAKRLKQVRNKFNLYDNKTEIFLSRREREILTDMCHGLTRDEIADDLSISVNTVKTNLNSIYSKLGALNSTHAATIATIKGLLLK